jgi:hypothetical protein
MLCGGFLRGEPNLRGRSFSKCLFFAGLSNRVVNQLVSAGGVEAAGGLLEQIVEDHRHWSILHLPLHPVILGSPKYVAFDI